MNVMVSNARAEARVEAARLGSAEHTTPASRPHYVPVGNEERLFKSAFRQ